MNYQFNIKCDIIRNNYSTDDGVGGAVVTGTILWANEPSRMDAPISRDINTLKQGIETTRGFTFFFHTNRQHVITINEEDVIRISFPTHHPYYNQTFVVRGVTLESFHPSANGLVEVYTNRIVQSRSPYFQ